MSQNTTLDFTISFCRDKMPGLGEDSYCCCFCDRAGSTGLLGVFDGCGGAGARKNDFYPGFPEYSGKTEAFMASRLCAGVFSDQFGSLFPSGIPAAEFAAQHLAPQTVKKLRDSEPSNTDNGIRIKGTGVRSMPSTAAAALIRHTGNGDTLVSAIWAGDSRVYVLDSHGLAQLTVDDTPVKDPMDNLYEDGVLQNVFCADKPVELHCSTFPMNGPFLVFSATDGCFGYLSTPMEFEGLLLATLLHAKFPAEWEAGLADAISAVSGDDHALCLASYGFGSFPAIQQEFSERFAYLNKYYLQHVSKLPVTDRESRKGLWAYYRKGYARFIEDGLT